ncbi:MAG: 4-hydroxybenzoate octaprenyltransferase [Planctomycetota bacterium]|nr:MAG: 4-hydroxybenzoate octaprenyltransferase [Planctomycetota bacterium]
MTQAGTEIKRASRVAWLAPIRVWADMVKFAHTVFALPFALMAAFLAARNLPSRTAPYAGQAALILLCMIGARSAAMTFNRIADARIDARNPRTQGRPLPAGRLSFTAAWAMFAAAVLVFLVGCALFKAVYENPWPLRLSLPVLAALLGYSYAKRFTKWSHLWLGAGIGLAPAAAWIAVHPGSLGWGAGLLWLCVTCWIGGFDILYACQDIDVDRREGLHSFPSRVGPARALALARVLHAAAIVALVVLGAVEDLGIIYGAGVAASAVLLVVENNLVRPGAYEKINVAFFTVNGVVSCVLAAAAILDVVR